MPHNKQAYDVVIIGAGIIGSTIARELSRFCVRVAVLDKAAEIPSGASRANSSMIHGGFDDVPGTVKAGFVAEGNRLYHELHKELDFHLDECGSYVCAFNEEETKRLHVLMEQGRANGVPGLEIVSGDQLREKEPNVSPAIIAALWSPTAAIVNNFEAVVAFMENAQMNGVELFLETEVTGLLMDESDSSVMGVSSSRGDFTAPVVINAAGVNSDLIARMAGDESFLIRPTRGEYFITDNRYGNLIKSFLFACPSEKGKGITVARTSEGNLLFGPSSVRQTDREDTSTTKEGLQFVMEGARRLLPAAGTHMSITTFAGVRANAHPEDFHISALKKPLGFVNVAGIKSPGFTCAPSIARYVVELVGDVLGDRVALRPNPDFIPQRRHIPRFSMMSLEEKAALVAENPLYGQIVCRCETVTEAQIVEAVRRGARTLSAVKVWTRAGTGRCQSGFCCPRIIEIMARELNLSPDELTRHGGDSRLLTGRSKSLWT